MSCSSRSRPSGLDRASGPREPHAAAVMLIRMPACRVRVTQNPAQNRACSPVRCERASRRELHAGLREKAVSWLRRAHGWGGGQPRGGQPQLQRAILQRADAEQCVLKHNAPRCLTQVFGCLQISDRNILYRTVGDACSCRPKLGNVAKGLIPMTDGTATDRQNLEVCALDSAMHTFSYSHASASTGEQRLCSCMMLGS